MLIILKANAFLCYINIIPYSVKIKRSRFKNDSLPFEQRLLLIKNKEEKLYFSITVPSEGTINGVKLFSAPGYPIFWLITPFVFALIADAGIGHKM